MSFQLLTTNEAAEEAVRSLTSQRYVSGANRYPELQIYENALQLSAKTPTSASVEVVIAHFDEDLAWINDLPCKPTIYSKGKDIRGVRLQNVGRELHTYLKHIVERYDKLADITYFFQGWPFDRSSAVIPPIRWLKHVEYIEFGTEIVDTGVVDHLLTHFYCLAFKRTPPSGWCFRANVQFAASRGRIHQKPREFYAFLLSLLEEGYTDDKSPISKETMPYLFEQVWAHIFTV